jgi:L-amino acid N-acyltransferase YncA
MPIFPELLDEKFPVKETIKDGTTVEIRTLHKDDTERLWNFFKTIPERDKIYLKEDLSMPAIAEEWCCNLDYCYMLPIVVILDDKIAGYAILQHEQRNWQRHIGTVRVVILPEYRQKGIAHALLTHIMDMGLHCGLEKLQAELMAEQEVAIRMFEHFGFIKVATIPDHVIDHKGKAHDYILMVYHMRDVERNAAD